MNLRVDEVAEVLLCTLHFQPLKTTLDRSLKIALSVDMESILKQNRQVEDYLRKPNPNKQYGVVLYSNGSVLVSSTDGNIFMNKSLFLDGTTSCNFPFPSETGAPFWDSLEERERSIERKCVCMTCMAVAAAIRAVPYCLPIIFLDASIIRTYHTKGVMLTATVATTEMKLLTVSVGTAMIENSAACDFFLANFRQALTNSA